MLAQVDLFVNIFLSFFDKFILFISSLQMTALKHGIDW